jgi:hypothetical protein
VSSTLRVYSGLYTDDLQALADRLDERLFGSKVGPALPETVSNVVPIDAAGL